MPTNADPRLDQLLSRWRQLHNLGQTLSAAELCHDCPELAPELERRLDELRRQNALDTPDSFASADTATSAPGPAPGERTHVPLPAAVGDYRVVRLLGQGGMGQVLEVEDPRLRRHVALKVLRPELVRSEQARQRFLREARAAAALHHDHVVDIYQVGEDGDQLFLVMPLLAGQSLQDRLARDGALAVAEVMRIGRETAAGLAAAHAAGLVHRDIKPANLWLEDPAGRVKVLDFGLARPEIDPDGISQAGAVHGTPAYMSPEQINGLPVDGRSDLFSLGCVLYRAATGQPAFQGPTLTALMRAVAEHQPAPPSSVRADLPRELSQLILRLLAKDPAGRPASADEVIRALTASGQRRQAPDAGSQVATAPYREPVRRSPLAAGWLRAALLLAGVLGAAVVAGGYYLLTQPPHQAATQDRPEAGAGVTEPLKVLRLELEHFALEGMFERPKGRLGQKSFSTHLKDSVEVAGRLSAPAYCYLIAYRPDGTEEVCFPQDRDAPPTPTAEPGYPSVKAGERYALEEGEGLMAFALVASREPLPVYAQWRQSRGASPWRRAAAQPDAVLRMNSGPIRTATAEDPDGDRSAGRPVKEQNPLVELEAWLRQEKRFEAVAVVAFPVLLPR